MLKQFKDCFEGVGCFQGEYRITVDPAVPPVVHPPRRVPEALRKPLKKELVSLVEQGILAKFTKPTDRVNFLVCVTKSTGALRLCLDPLVLSRSHTILHLRLKICYLNLMVLNASRSLMHAAVTGISSLPWSARC